MDIAKIMIAGVIAAAVYSLIKQIRPELAPLAAFAGVAVIGISISSKLFEITETAGNMTIAAGIQSKNTAVLVKCAAICIITRLGADICNDNSCTAIGDMVELSGKIGAVAAAMPLIISAADFALGLMTG
ncbi:MAG: hypothetical protein MJ173_04025 [Clostridia bacterium]|nr:hypothetical protein [Clostridia bacterium]